MPRKKKTTDPIGVGMTAKQMKRKKPINTDMLRDKEPLTQNQQILFNEKGKIVQQKNIFHGYQSKVKVTSESKIFKKNKIFKVGRYHSLKLYEPFKSNNTKITMRCVKSNIPMAFENKENNVYGFQFHPESFLTENGNFIIKKILSS